MDQASKLRELVQANQEISNARVIAVTSGKGGVGKTTLSVNIALEIEKRGKLSIDREESLLKIIDGFKDHFGQLTEKVNIIKIDVDDIKEKLDKR